jgi:transcriptional regulator with XRE-family HTH domain
MKKEKRGALKAAGWVSCDAEDFLELTQAERDLVELRLAVSRAVHARRKREGLTQAQAAERLNTSQSRFARIEAGARGVSLDLMFRSRYALGGTLKDVRTTPRGRRQLARLVPSDGEPLTLSRRTKPRGHRPPSQ